MSDQTKPNAETPEYRAALEQAASDILKMVMKAMADPEGGIAIDQVIALIDGHIGPTLLTETPKPETQAEKSFDEWWATWPVFDADRLLLTDKGLASLAWRAALMSVKPETRAGAMEARKFANHLLTSIPNVGMSAWRFETVIVYLAKEIVARDAKRDAEVAKSARKAITDYIKSGKTISGEPTDLDLALDKFAAKIRAEASELAFLRGKLAAVKQYAPTRWTLIASDLEDQIKQLRIPPQPEKPKGLNEK